MGFKTKDGEVISWKEFFNRWKKGIAEVTPKQKIESQILFTRIMIIGFICGFVISLVNFKNLWWVAIVLFAAIGNTVIQYISLVQQKRLFENIENNILGSEEVAEVVDEKGSIEVKLEENTKEVN